MINLPFDSVNVKLWWSAALACTVAYQVIEPVMLATCLELMQGL